MDRTAVPAVADIPLRPDRDGIDDLLQRLDETVTIHQRWARLAETVRAHRAVELEIGNDRALSAAAAYTRVLVEMGEWGKRVGDDPRGTV
jgi:hypothetical protein